MITLADSQVLRWIDEINGVTDADAKAKEIKRSIREQRKLPCTRETKLEIKRLYKQLDALQFKKDYMCLIIDKKKDYYRACKGFTINDVKYVRLLGTNGGIKNSTIVFVSERVAGEIKKRIENGRDPNKELVTAKLEAYKALACSASNPVSWPKKIAVVPDAETEFLADYIYITNEDSPEPVMSEKHNEPTVVDATDGFGLMCPELAQRWSEELGLDYMVAGVNTRASFEKGMVYTFDFVEFARDVAGTYIFKDAWGDEVDIREVELIFTTSMVKLWDSYKSCDDYLENCTKNKYDFGITKTCPKELEDEHTLNYQFIQSFRLSDEDIDELIEPTITEIENVLRNDWRSTVLFLKGIGLNQNNVRHLPDDYVKALMIDRRVMNDPYVQNSIFHLIKGRIDAAKTGIIKVHGNYSMISGDPYILCESIFGMEKKGLLKAGEIYNKYWADDGARDLLCFRAPMSTHANIRKVCVNNNDQTNHWYRYMSTVTILNAWDTTTAALNGCDFDGDLVMLTDNEVLLRNHRELPAIMCAQQKAEKRVSTEEDFIQANIASFGNEIGQTTNYITSMYEVQAGFDENSKEYNMLEYRIMSGQLIQQQIIDKAKGIIAVPMPKTWYDGHAVNKMDTQEDPEKKELYKQIVADRKPYFMKYIYPSLNYKLNQFIKESNRSCMSNFGLTVDELRQLPKEELDEEQALFLEKYDKYMPVGMNACVMNKIAWKIEDRLDRWFTKNKLPEQFDYSFMKSDEDYTEAQFKQVQKLYGRYNAMIQEYNISKKYEKLDDNDSYLRTITIETDFLEKATKACTNRNALLNICLDLCYTKASSKSFVWRICGEEIIDNLLKINGDIISYPLCTPAGDYEYAGRTFKIDTTKIERWND